MCPSVEFTFIKEKWIVCHKIISFGKTSGHGKRWGLRVVQEPFSKLTIQNSHDIAVVLNIEIYL